MNTQENLNRIYQLYSEKNYSDAFVLVQEILKNEPQNPYAKRYEQLIRPYLNDKSEVGKIQTIKGKSLKCPHCQSAISLSALNDDQKTKIRDNNYNNLEIKCSYCHTTFTLQKKTFESFLGIQIGDQIIYNSQKYRVVGGVDYFGNWGEGGYTGPLSYFEWILLSEFGSYLYFSEGYFIDDGEKNYEFEFSHKITPKFSLGSVVPGLGVHINNSLVRFSETNLIKAQRLYGENSKVFKVGEQVEIGEFSHGGKKYVVEIESAGRQSESGIYETKSVSQKEACRIFNKEYHKLGATFSVSKGDSDGEFWSNVVIGFIAITWVFFTMFPKSIITIGIIVVILWISKKYFSPEKFKILCSLLLLGPIFGIITFFASQIFFEKKIEIPIEKIYSGKHFETNFKNPNLQAKEFIKTKNYDYGGVERIYKIREGLRFSVENDEDREILQKIRYGENASPLVKEIFSEKIYKLR